MIIQRIKLMSRYYRWLILVVVVYFIALEAYPALTGASANSTSAGDNLPLVVDTSYTVGDQLEKKVSVSATVDQYIETFGDGQSSRAETNLPNGLYQSSDSFTSKY